MKCNEWKTYTLDEIYEFSSGLSKKREEFGFGYSFLTFKDVFNNFFLPEELIELVNSSEKERYKCSIKRGDVFLTRTSENQDELGISSVALKDYPEATFNGFTKRLRSKENIDILPEFAGFYFRSPKFRRQVTSMSILSTRASLNNSMLSKLTIDVPPINEQIRIANVLKSIYDKINTNIKVIKNLKEISETIFKRWFIEFEFPNENGETYRSSGGKMVESDLGWIPESWRVLEMGDFLTYKNKRVGDLDLTEYSTTNNGIKLRDEKFKKQLSKNTSKNKIIEKNDIVFGNSREILNFGVMKDSIGAVSSAYNVFSVDNNIYNAELLELYMRSRSVYFLSLIKPGGRDNQGIDKQFLQIKKVIVPDKKIQDYFFHNYTIIKNSIDSFSDEKNQLTEIRDSLLPRLLSGEIEIPIESEDLEDVQL